MPEEFVKYLLKCQHKKVHDPNKRPITLAHPGQHPPPDLLADFKRGVIWDLAVFEMIKDIKQWDSWTRTFMATAEAQGVEKVINPKYIPQPPEDALFCEQKKYMYSILLNVVKAKTLKAIMINATKEAVPDCWDAMCKEAEQSTSAEIKSLSTLHLQRLMTVNGVAH